MTDQLKLEHMHLAEDGEFRNSYGPCLHTRQHYGDQEYRTLFCEDCHKHICAACFRTMIDATYETYCDECKSKANVHICVGCGKTMGSEETSSTHCPPCFMRLMAVKQKKL